jgi:hypothetical protein
MSVESILRSSDAAAQGRLSQIYDQEAFRYLLAVERTRAERSYGSFLLVLVNLNNVRCRRGRLTPGIAAKLLAGLSLAVRDGDFIGWFREGRVAGAVLTQAPDSLAPDVRRQVSQRITATLRERLPAPLTGRVRVLHVQPAQKR